MPRFGRGNESSSQGQVAFFLKNSVEWLIRLFDGDKTFYPPHDFPWIKEVEGYIGPIQQELNHILENKLSPSWEQVSYDPNVQMGEEWKTFIFCFHGNWVEPNLKVCPQTYLALQKIKGLRTAWFSVLEPHTHLVPHHGPYNGVLRYHLGLTIPSEDKKICGIQVGNTMKTWGEGKSLVFDDTHLHDAWNFTQQKRVVLFVDFERPLPFPLNLINKLVLQAASKTSFAREVKNRAKSHVKNFRAEKTFL